MNSYARGQEPTSGNGLQPYQLTSRVFITYTLGNAIVSVHPARPGLRNTWLVSGDKRTNMAQKIYKQLRVSQAQSHHLPAQADTDNNGDTQSASPRAKTLAHSHRVRPSSTETGLWGGAEEEYRPDGEIGVQDVQAFDPGARGRRRRRRLFAPCGLHRGPGRSSRRRRCQGTSRACPR
ncbi:uncharacterized protein BJX67DRAFT_347919, partial [Aspergillus lucknowensis]